jgi:hypothetical protein
MLGLVTFPHRYRGSLYLRIRIDRSSSPRPHGSLVPTTWWLPVWCGTRHRRCVSPGRRTCTSRWFSKRRRQVERKHWACFLYLRLEMRWTKLCDWVTKLASWNFENSISQGTDAKRVEKRLACPSWSSINTGSVMIHFEVDLRRSSSSRSWCYFMLKFGDTVQSVYNKMNIDVSSDCEGEQVLPVACAWIPASMWNLWKATIY